MPVSSRRDFARLSSGGVSRGSSHLVLKGIVDGEGEVLVSMSVSKRTRNAVERNRLRRRIRHAVLEAQNRGAWQGGIYLIVAKENADSASYTELVAEVSQLSEKLVGLKGPNPQGAR